MTGQNIWENALAIAGIKKLPGWGSLMTEQADNIYKAALAIVSQEKTDNAQWDTLAPSWITTAAAEITAVENEIRMVTGDTLLTKGQRVTSLTTVMTYHECMYPILVELVAAFLWADQDEGFKAQDCRNRAQESLNEIRPAASADSATVLKYINMALGNCLEAENAMRIYYFRAPLEAMILATSLTAELQLHDRLYQPMSYLVAALLMESNGNDNMGQQYRVQASQLLNRCQQMTRAERVRDVY